MVTRSELVLSLLPLICPFLAFAQQTEFQPGRIWNDNNGVHINAHGGGIMLYNDTYYWYGEHKIGGTEGNFAQVGVHVYSSSDLYNWKDEGIALRVIGNDSSRDISRGCVLERPKVIYSRRTRRFVMWFHLEPRGRGYDAARTGIAVADNPAGPFAFIRSFRPDAGTWPMNVLPVHRLPVSSNVQKKYCGGYGCLPAHPDSLNLLGRDFEGGQMARDMNLFVDDDGTAYHVYTSEENSTIHISQLTDDYLGYSGRYARFFVNRYMEAPTIFKTGDGKYFFIGSDCTGWAPNAARSAWAPSIWGPWTELGNPCRGSDSVTTFHSQGTYVLRVKGRKDAFIFMSDRWRPENAIDGRYIWLPVQFEAGQPVLRWFDRWGLGFFDN